MKNIKEYKVIQAASLDALIKSVNESIANGWSPQGGICEAGSSNYLFFQAMVYKIDN